ncbi:hypothetical protein AALP_AA7G133400 [Arabis alpina]|uniref:Uncharacterized protein n=1 Tax=Arabis alpina TaxID=50452 RepID=A0A087GHS7_ARAAL|nr:hypothetical protein AALP_AA7G133400 [Arabis alpina]
MSLQREETGAGMKDCKKALSEKVQECLRTKGLSTADKISSHLAEEGRTGSYIHDSRIGVDDLAMRFRLIPKVQYVSIDDIPEEIKQKEKEL